LVVISRKLYTSTTFTKFGTDVQHHSLNSRVFNVKEFLHALSQRRIQDFGKGENDGE